MSSSSAPPAPPDVPEDFAIEIDPSLIEAALAAVDRRLGGSAPAGGGADGPEPGIELVFDTPEQGMVPPDDGRRRLQVRAHEQAEQIRRLEGDLARTAEARDLLDRQLRDLRKGHGDLSTDFERFRTRARKDVEEAERRGEDKILRPLVDVYDNVERAWLHAVSDPAQILGGLQMIVEQFKRLFTRFGFERIDTDRGTLFDPACHEAVMHVQSDDVAPGTVVDEVQAGFRLRGRLFRPARVTVSAPVPGSAE